MPVRNRGRCEHCHKTRHIVARRLCTTCYKTPAIRAIYPSGHQEVFTGRAKETLADLEATIAKQLQCKPWWWKDESSRLERCEPGRDDPTIPAAVRMGDSLTRTLKTMGFNVSRRRRRTVHFWG